MKEQARINFPLRRPPDSASQIRRTLSKVDCLSCGICCRHEKAVPVIGADPSREIIRQFLKSGGYSKRMEPAPNRGFNILLNGRCPALAQEEGKPTCSIYDFRPAFCKIFPFVPGFLQIETGSALGQVMAMHLDNMCPPLKELQDAEIGFVVLTDISSIDFDMGNMRIFCENNLLGAALKNLFGLMKRDILGPDILFSDGERIIFPIF